MKPEVDPESTLIGAVVLALIGIIGVVIKRLIGSLGSSGSRESDLRAHEERLKADMHGMLAPLADDIRELKNARIAERLAAIETELRLGRGSHPGGFGDR